MRTRKSFLELSLAANRNLLAIIIISISLIAIATISIFYFQVAESVEAADRIFGALLPLLATWIGTVLAFYFGRENFEAATDQYKELITNLTPDVLDDIQVNQIMITKKTLVGKELAEAKTKSVDELIKFLEEVDKSRLPIFDNSKPKYIIHSSTLLQALKNHKESQKTEVYSFDSFVQGNHGLISSFLVCNEFETLEKVRILLRDQPKSKDVFVKNEEGEVLGWLTDTLIYRFIKE